MGDSKGHRHRDRRQVAALPLGRDETGRIQVLLVTSRGTGRWVLPKGWPMKGRKPHRAAEREAFEEAGLVGKVRKEPLGTYRYDKTLDTGATIPCEVTVFPLRVEGHRARWPEMAERQRRWFSLDDAVQAVAEAGLRDILRDIARREP